MLRDLAEITHWVSVVKITPDAAEDPTVSADERSRGQLMADTLPMRVLTRLWQMLLKSLEEVSAAPNAMMAAEMAIIRMTHVADLPTPDELVRKITGGGGTNASSPAAAATTHSSAGTKAYTQAVSPATAPQSPVTGAALRAPQPEQALAQYPSFEHVIELIRTNRDVKLLVEVETALRLANYQPGRIEFVPTDTAPADLAQRLGARLQQWTGNRWAVTVVNEGGAETIAEVRDAAAQQERAKAEVNPLVQTVLAQFPKARITAIRTPQEIASAALGDALPEVEDEWDPFEED